MYLTHLQIFVLKCISVKYFKQSAKLDRKAEKNNNVIII